MELNTDVPAAGRGEKNCYSRSLFWYFDVLVLVWAVGSLLGWGYGHWVDLRRLGACGPVLAAVWTASVMAMVEARWKGWTLGWERALLVPSYLLLVVLGENTVRYWVLKCRGEWQTGGWVPMSLVGFLVLLIWVCVVCRGKAQNHQIAAREAPISPGALDAKTPSGMTPPYRSPMTAPRMLWITLCAVGAFWFFGLQFRQSDLPASGEPVDLAVVLGNAVLADGTASRLLEDRVMGAVELYKRGEVKYIMLSGAMHGGGENSPPPKLKTQNAKQEEAATAESPKVRVKGGVLSEAVAMEKICLREGIPDSALIVDPMGINTRATVVNALAVMRQRGFKTVVGVSDDSHLWRIERAFADKGVKVYVYPARHDLWPLADPLAVLREAAGIVVYAVDPNYRITEAERMDVKLPRIVVKKREKKLELYDGQQLVKSYACISGRAAGDKEVEGDLKTPEGTFKICYKNPESKFHLSMGLDYPNIKDAERGLKAGLITQAEHDQIVEAVKSGGVPNWYTKLGGEIFIHGNGEGRAGTLGCVAMKDSEVEELYAVCDLGTVVEVRP